MKSFADAFKDRKEQPKPWLQPTIVDKTGNDTTEDKKDVVPVTFNGVEEKPKSYRKTTADIRQEQKNAIVEQYGGISNIPINSKYWSL